MISNQDSRQRCTWSLIKSAWNLLFPDPRVPFVKVIDVILGATAESMEFLPLRPSRVFLAGAVCSLSSTPETHILLK